MTACSLGVLLVASCYIVALKSERAGDSNLKRRHAADFEDFGCFKRSATDTTNKKEAPPLHDETCAKVHTDPSLSAGEPCRSGLPFYRRILVDGEMTSDCFEFCVERGMDLFGILESECRCGATVANFGIWDGHLPPPALRLPVELLGEDDPECELMVWKFSGPMPDLALPVSLIANTDADAHYISLVGRGVSIKEGPGVVPGLLQTSSKGLCKDTEGVIESLSSPAECAQLVDHCQPKDPISAVVRQACPVSCQMCTSLNGLVDCYPGVLCQAGRPWPKKDGTVTIYYYFEGLDEMRKDTFRDAIQYFPDAGLCIEFVENQKQPKPGIKVAIVDEAECSVGLGYPGKGEELTLNMGWCSTMDAVGTVVHQLGRALGMANEQVRPDGTASVYIEGEGEKKAHLNIFWEKIDKGMKSQWEPVSSAYLGKDGAYAPYDFESIMADRISKKDGETRPKSKRWEVGQRDHLSKGDIKQLKDVYGC